MLLLVVKVEVKNNEAQFQMGQNENEAFKMGSAVLFISSLLVVKLEKG